MEKGLRNISVFIWGWSQKSLQNKTDTERITQSDWDEHLRVNASSKFQKMIGAVFYVSKIFVIIFSTVIDDQKLSKIIPLSKSFKLLISSHFIYVQYLCNLTK